MTITRNIRIAAIALLLITFFTGTAMAAGTDASDEKELELLYLLNDLRLGEGLYPVSSFEALDEAADIRADELIAKYSHERPDGRACFSVLDELSILYHTAAENIAAGYRSAADVMDTWYNSSDHRSSMLNSGFRHVGIGYKNTGNYWAQLFVGGCTVESISVEAIDPYFEYSAGTTIKEIADSMNYRIVGKCSMHGEFSLPINASMCSGYDSSLLGDQTITVICYGQTARLTLTLIEGDPYVIGDANNNGKLDVGDVTLILRYVVNIIDERGLNMDVADFNGDGKVNTGDATAILRALV